MYRNCVMRRKVKEKAARLIGSRASTLFLGLKYTYWYDWRGIYMVRNRSWFWCVGCHLQRERLVPRSKDIHFSLINNSGFREMRHSYTRCLRRAYSFRPYSECPDSVCPVSPYIEWAHGVVRRLEICTAIGCWIWRFLHLVGSCTFVFVAIITTVRRCLLLLIILLLLLP
jgi:hypothetical protein